MRANFKGSAPHPRPRGAEAGRAWACKGSRWESTIIDDGVRYGVAARKTSTKTYDTYPRHQFTPPLHLDEGARPDLPRFSCKESVGRTGCKAQSRCGPLHPIHPLTRLFDAIFFSPYMRARVRLRGRQVRQVNYGSAHPRRRDGAELV